MARDKAALAAACHQERPVSPRGPGSFLSLVKVAPPPAPLALLPIWGLSQASSPKTQALFTSAALA